ncbi:hypothetical protein ES703_101092 [subsurface metagenome]
MLNRGFKLVIDMTSLTSSVFNFSVSSFQNVILIDPVESNNVKDFTLPDPPSFLINSVIGDI